MKRLKKRNIIWLCLLLTVGFLVPAGANSALKSWSGVEGSALSVKDGCPVEVLREKLTVEVNAFPEANRPPQRADAAVTAEYTLKNPTEETVSVRLFFPVGQTPAYGYISNDYGVWTDGAPADVTRRFSCSPYLFTDITQELEKLRDGYVATELLQPDTPVTTVSFRLGGFSAETEVTVRYSGDGRAVLYDTAKDIFMEQTQDGGVRFTALPGAVCRIAVFGPAAGTFTWTFTEAGAGTPLPEAYAEETGRETLPFAEFAALGAPEDSPIGPADRFNAAADELDALLRQTEPGEISFTQWELLADDSSYMEWYEYTLTFAPGQTLVNKVTAPFFPDIDMYWQPTKYEYTYLLSPASGWAAFGGLDIDVRTPYYLLDSSLEGFEKTETGWILHTDGLPDKELTLTFCESDAPQRDPGTRQYTVLLLAVFGAGFLLAAAAIAGIVVLAVKLMKKKAGKQKK